MCGFWVLYYEGEGGHLASVARVLVQAGEGVAITSHSVIEVWLSCCILQQFWNTECQAFLLMWDGK